MAVPYIGDVGTVIRLHTNSDLTSITTVNFEVKKPDGTKVTWPASKQAGTASYAWDLVYTVQAGDFDQVGDYVLQAVVSDGSGQWSLTPIVFTVRAKFA